MMSYAIQKRGCHLSIAEDRDPLSELQNGGDYDTGLLIELADQMEQQLRRRTWGTGCSPVRR